MNAPDNEWLRRLRQLRTHNLPLKEALALANEEHPEKYCRAPRPLLTKEVT